MTGADQEGRQQRDPEEDRERPPIPAAATSVVVSSAAPSEKAPARPGGIRGHARSRRGATRGRARSPSVPSTALIGDVRPARRAG